MLFCSNYSVFSPYEETATVGCLSEIPLLRDQVLTFRNTCLENVLNLITTKLHKELLH